MDALEDVLFGSVAGAISKYLEYPFDTIKVRLQSQPDHLPPLYSGPLDCFKKSLRSVPGGAPSGLLSLYCGISAPLAAAVLENSSLFFWERVAQHSLRKCGLFPDRERLPLVALWVTGAIAGAATSLVLTPFELVKCRVQAPSSKEATSTPLKVVQDIWRHKGIRGFWKGQLSTFIRESIGSAAWFGSKESVSSLFRSMNKNSNSPTLNHEFSEASPLPLYQQALAGASAGMSYNLISFPADTIKSRMQTSTSNTKPRSYWQESRAVWQHHGVRGFYRGCGITVMRSAPSSALIFCIFDGMKEHMSFRHQT
ncbi:Amino-acid transporter arg-13 [Golovinomyces cichoracearum]|uniref:Amino-acid transporter arg-13 n=1 Tax=Golovinomyces cichoracearum TaxID=62708 RepID=A0A420IGR3_9PEZI|nr:Amino-acid transporter arg-13 [Golovinomyces cichoracearum]